MNVNDMLRSKMARTIDRLQEFEAHGPACQLLMIEFAIRDLQTIAKIVETENAEMLHKYDALKAESRARLQERVDKLKAMR